MKYLLTFLMVVAIDNLLISQEWAPAGATWHLDTYDLFGYNKQVSTLSSLKDTVFQGQVCKLIYRDQTTCLGRPHIEFMFLHVFSG